MKHDAVHEALSAYLDNRADDPESIAQHLTECDECREDLAELRAVVGLLHRVPNTAPPRAFRLDELAVRRHRRAGARPLDANWQWALRAVTAAAAVLFLFLLGGDLRLWIAPSPVSVTSSPSSALPLNQSVAPAEAMPAVRAASPADGAAMPAEPLVGGVVYRVAQGALLVVMVSAGVALWWLSRRAI